jgi:hypothetical protein
VFSFSLNSRNFFDSLSYFLYDPFIIWQCVVQLPIVCIFSAAAFVVESQFYCTVIQQYAGVFSIFLYLVNLSLCPMIRSILEKVLWLLRRMYIVLFQGEIFCKHWLGPFDLTNGVI